MRAKKNYLADKNLNNVAHKRELLSTFQTIASLFYAKEACKKWVETVKFSFADTASLFVLGSPSWANWYEILNQGV